VAVDHGRLILTRASRRWRGHQRGKRVRSRSGRRRAPHRPRHHPGRRGLNIIGIREKRPVTFGSRAAALRVRTSSRVGILHWSRVAGDHVAERRRGVRRAPYNAAHAVVGDHDRRRQLRARLFRHRAVIQPPGSSRAAELAQALLVPRLTVGIVTAVVSALRMSARFDFRQHRRPHSPTGRRWWATSRSASWWASRQRILIMAVNTAYVASRELLERCATAIASTGHRDQPPASPLYRIHVPERPHVHGPSSS